MSAEHMARRTEIRLTFEGADITQDVNKYLQSFTYTDNEKDEVDDIQFTLDDREDLWLKSWLNRNAGGSMTGGGDGRGAVLTAVIARKNWNSDGVDSVLDCGSFEVYTVSVDGPPSKITIKAGSIPFSSTARTEKKTKAWENYTLSGIAGEIAGKAGMTPMYLSAHDPNYPRREQLEQSDIVFLEGLCHSAGVSLKVTAKTLVLFDAAEFEQKGAVLKLQKGKSTYRSYSFDTTLHDTAYTKCTVSYTDPKNGKTYKGVYEAPDAEKNGIGQSLSIRDEAVSSDGEAETLAKKRLREKNCQAFTASFSLPGDTGLVAGVTLQVEGWGAFDGKYLVEKAVHAISNGGYTTKLTCRRVLEGY